jgi:hypothetical protein
MSSKAWRRFHGCLVIFWLVLWGAGWVFGWLSSVTFVSHLSAVALVLASLSSWQAARVEVNQEEEEKK